MSTIAEIAARAAATAAQDQDTSTAFERELPAAGKTGLRFIEYIELGFQKQKPYMGKEKPPAMEVMLGMELLGKNYVKEIEVNGEKKLIADKITIRTTVKLSDKAWFRKVWNKMVYGRPGIQHVAQMLGEAFIGTITHSPDKDDAGKALTVYANLRTADGEVGLAAPFLDLPEMGEDGQPTGEVVKTELKVRDALSPLRIFIFEDPTKETWDSLFIDGTREVKAADGTVTKESKNWIQEKILSSTKYPGSALEAMLHDLGGLTIDPEVSPATEGDDPPFEADETAPPATAKAPPAAAKVKAPVTPPAKTTATADAAAALAALGLE